MADSAAPIARPQAQQSASLVAAPQRRRWVRRAVATQIAPSACAASTWLPRDLRAWAGLGPPPPRGGQQTLDTGPVARVLEARCRAVWAPPAPAHAGPRAWPWGGVGPAACAPDDCGHRSWRGVWADPDADIQEVAACCQGLDLDEPVMGIAKALDRGAELPGWLAWSSGYAVLAGIYYGALNLRVSLRTAHGLRTRRAAVDARIRGLLAAPPAAAGGDLRAAPWQPAARALPPAQRRAAKMQAARSARLGIGLGMQQFIAAVPGTLQIVGTAVTGAALAGVAGPWLGVTSGALALAGAALLAAYCGAHVVRYLGWEARRAATGLPARRGGQPRPPRAAAGAEAFAAVQRRRLRLFLAGSATFAVYGLGAAGMAAAALGAAPALALPAAMALIVGAAAVTPLNNGPLPAAMTSNHDTHVDSGNYWGKASLLRQLDFQAAERRALAALAAELPPAGARTRVAGAAIEAWLLASYVALGWGTPAARRARERACAAGLLPRLDNAALRKFFAASATAKAAQLREEQAAHAGAEADVCAADPDAASRPRAHAMLDAWATLEACRAERATAPAHASPPHDDAATLDLLWSHLAARDLLDDVLPLLCAATPRAAVPWWQGPSSSQTFSVDVLKDALQHPDPETAATAASTWATLRALAVMVWQLPYHQRLRQADGALVDQIVARLRLRRP